VQRPGKISRYLVAADGQATRRTLSLTSTGIRQHLTVLERDGSWKRVRSGARRPAAAYRLTPSDGLTPKYEALANALIEEARLAAEPLQH
jgi:predicted ArsR family transcriptional regulator